MRLVLGTILLGLLGVPALADEQRPAPKPGITERARLEVAPPGRTIKQLTIENPLGNVRVEGYDGTALQIETHKHAPDAESLERLRVSLVPNPDGTVRIRTTADGGPEMKSVTRDQVRIDLIIRAPRDVRVDATASAGSLEIVNMDAGGELDTSSGAIFVHNVQGDLLTHSVSGPMKLVQVFGVVDAQNLSADVDLDSISGARLAASTGRGRIGGRRLRSREIELITTHGRITVEAEVALRGRMVVSSVHGDVDVKLRHHGAVFVRARGGKLDLGGLATAATLSSNGWSQVSVAGDGEPAAIELQSRTGVVRFALLQSGKVD